MDDRMMEQELPGKALDPSKILQVGLVARWTEPSIARPEAHVLFDSQVERVGITDQLPKIGALW